MFANFVDVANFPAPQGNSFHVVLMLRRVPGESDPGIDDKPWKTLVAARARSIDVGRGAQHNLRTCSSSQTLPQYHSSGRGTPQHKSNAGELISGHAPSCLIAQSLDSPQLKEPIGRYGVASQIALLNSFVVNQPSRISAQK